MAWALVLLTLLTQDTGSSAQSGLTQPPSMSGSPGQSVTISCTGTSNDVGKYNYVSWYQQRPGTLMKLLIYDVSTRPSGIPDHFSGSKSGNTASLTISGVLAEDKADYYCCSYRSDGTLHSGASSWGSETKTCFEFTQVLTAKLRLSFVLFFDIVLFGRSWAQSGLTQPSSMSGVPGQSVTISCTGTSNDVGGYNYVSWYQQHPGTLMKLLIYDVSTRPSGIPDHFSGSKSGNTASLTISGVLPEDEAVTPCPHFLSPLPSTLSVSVDVPVVGSPTSGVLQ
ncbi:uncharacterized protein LOC128588754 [Nycticebus coucang]|uniref:uncharacterized protein LOC128588754 n=1 Tax=Nycticebus coucang TaxID=9470 RepID=UPI00234CC818|nr:uncharacterized protein LOC128588754 [Nycticebus coucang]